MHASGSIQYHTVNPQGSKVCGEVNHRQDLGIKFLQSPKFDERTEMLM